MVGKKAPLFSGNGNDCKGHSFKEHKGKWIVLFFYPKADTPG